MEETINPAWLAFIHQLPASPAYLRVKVARRLQAIGALPLKNTVYVLPRNDTTLEDFHWLRREVVDGGGEATILECAFVEGLTEAEATAAFNKARSAAFAEIEQQARQLREKAGEGEPLKHELVRLRALMAEASALDYLGAPGRDAALDRLAEAESALIGDAPESPATAVLDPSHYRGRTWVTRTGVFVDRIASAWLIRRNIDPDARFRFVASRSPRLEKGEVSFDMFEADFTHEGDLCTFEVLLKRFDIRDRTLHRIAELIHDLDVKDDRHSRPEAPGVLAVFVGIAARHRKDDDRLKAGFEFLDSLKHGVKGGP